MKPAQIDLRVTNLDCDSEAAAITRGLGGDPGIVRVRVWPKSARLRIDYDADATSREAIEHRLHTMGFPLQAGRPAGPQPPWRHCSPTNATSSRVIVEPVLLTKRTAR